MTDSRDERYLLGLAALLALVLGATAIFCAYNPTPALWSLSNAADLPTSLQYGWIILGVTLAVAAGAPLRLRSSIIDRAGRLLRTRSASFIVPAGAMVIFLAFRSQNHYLGDGFLLGTFLERDGDPIELRPGLGSLWVYRLAYRLGVLFGAHDHGLATFAVVSSLAGAILVGLVLQLSREIGDLFTPHKPESTTFLIGTLLLTAGHMQLFFGYAESYPIANLLVVAFLASGVRSIAGNRSPAVALLLFGLAVIAHWCAIIAAPAALYLLLRRSSSETRGVVLALPMVLAALWIIAPPTVSQLNIHNLFVPWTRGSTPVPYGVFSIHHLTFNAGLLLLLVPAPLVIAIAGSLQKRRRAEPYIIEIQIFTGIAALVFITFPLVVRPFLGPRDWDLFAFLAGPAALWAGIMAVRRFPSAQLPTLAAISASIGLFLVAPWIAGNARPDVAAPRTARLCIEDLHMLKKTPPLLANLAGIMWEKGERDAPRVLYEKVAEESPETRIARANLGIIYWGEDRFGEAKPHLEAAVELGPELHVPRYYLGATYFHLEEGDLGEEQFREVLRLDPGNRAASGYLGRILMWKGEWSSARRLLEVAHTADPDDAGVNVWLGQTCYNLGDRVAAAEYLTRALEIDPELDRARAVLEELRGTTSSAHESAADR